MKSTGGMVIGIVGIGVLLFLAVVGIAVMRSPSLLRTQVVTTKDFVLESTAEPLPTESPDSFGPVIDLTEYVGILDDAGVDDFLSGRGALVSLCTCNCQDDAGTNLCAHSYGGPLGTQCIAFRRPVLVFGNCPAGNGTSCLGFRQSPPSETFTVGIRGRLAQCS